MSQEKKTENASEESKEEKTEEPESKPEEKQNKQDDRDKVRSGMIVSVYEKVIDVTPKGEKRERIQLFKGMVLARKHGKEIGASITVRKQSGDVVVEKIFPIYSPLIDRIVIEKRFKVRRSKLFFLRDTKQRLREIR